MKIKVLASGSKGNCAVVLGTYTNIIIDMGISYLTLKNKLEENSLSLDNFEGILITHCHKDHTNGLKTLIHKTNLKVYIPREMYESLQEMVPEYRCEFIDDTFNINELNIELIHTSHDAPCSVGFIIESEGRNLIYVTDTGYINRKFLKKMHNKNVYVIESNHDEVMLMDGPYPRFLKERVISDKGHLSNITTSKYLKNLVGENTKHIVLAHLSETNNTKELAYTTTRNEISNQNIEIEIATQQDGSSLIEV